MYSTCVSTTRREPPLSFPVFAQARCPVSAPLLEKRRLGLQFDRDTVDRCPSGWRGAERTWLQAVHQDAMGSRTMNVARGGVQVEKEGGGEAE